ncbi:hypothetical protein Trydic_g8501 [Trypoxylus dichotomus]
MEFIEKDMDPSNRLNKVAKQALRAKVSECALAQAELIGHIKRLEADNERLRQEVRTPVPPVPYAAAVGNISKESTNSRAKPLTLFVSGKASETMKEVQTTFITLVNPEDKIKIKPIRKTNKTIIVEMADDSDLQKLRQHKILNDQLRVEPAKKRNPLLILYDVPSDIKEDSIKEAVYEQNFAEQLSRQEKLCDLRPDQRGGQPAT